VQWVDSRHFLCAVHLKISPKTFRANKGTPT